MNDVLVRILARLEAPLLQRHCGAVLDEELRRVRDELNAVLAAFERLQEVREAVASLEADRSDARRSAGLMEEVDATALLQDVLTLRIEEVHSAVRARSVKPSAEPETVKRAPCDPVKAEPNVTQPNTLKRKRHVSTDDEPTPVKLEKQASPETQVRTPVKSEVAPVATPALSYFHDEAASSSETESEHDDPLPAIARRRKPMELALWEQHVHETGKFAQRLFATKGAPSIDDLTQLVDAVEGILGSVPPPGPDRDFRGLAKGQFNNVLSLTVRVFQRGQRNKSFVPLAERTLRALDDAATYNVALHGLRKYYDELREIKRKTEQYETTTSTDPEGAQSESSTWGRQLAETMELGIVIISAKRRFTVEEFTTFVASLGAVLESVETPPGATFASLAKGHFKKLIALTVRMFQRVKRYASHSHVTQTAIDQLERASARSAELLELSSYTDKLRELKRTMEESDTPASATFNLSKWKRGVDQLRTFIHQATKQQAVVSLEQVNWICGGLCEMLTKGSAAPSTNNELVSASFHSVLLSAQRIFQLSEVDANYLPPLDKVLATVKSVSRDHKRFHMLPRHIRDLEAAKARLGGASSAVGAPIAPIRAKPGLADSSSSPADAVLARFEALVNAADELLAVPVSERTGRAPHFVFSLQKELKAAFPTKGKRATPSRGALGAAAEAVCKAVELLQHEPRSPFHNQFLELLFNIGAKYHTLKLLVARSRDDLYQYIYVNAQPPRPQAPTGKPKPAAVAVGASVKAVAAADEAVLREQLLTTHRRVQSWHDDVFSLKEFDEALRVVRAVMGHTGATWRVTRDRTVADCLRLLALRARAIKKQEHRDGRLASVAQWQARMEV